MQQWLLLNTPVTVDKVEVVLAECVCYDDCVRNAQWSGQCVRGWVLTLLARSWYHPDYLARADLLSRCYTQPVCCIGSLAADEVEDRRFVLTSLQAALLSTRSCTAHPFSHSSWTGSCAWPRGQAAEYTTAHCGALNTWNMNDHGRLDTRWPLLPAPSFAHFSLFPLSCQLYPASLDTVQRQPLLWTLNTTPCSGSC